MKKRLLALLLALAMGLSLAACSTPAADLSGDPSASPSASADPSASPSPEIVADLSQDILTFAAGDLAKETGLLTVNGEEIPASLFFYWLAFSCSYFESAYSSYGLTVDSYGSAILSDCCTMAAYYALLGQKVAENGCQLTDEQLAAVVTSLEVGSDTYNQRRELYGLSEEDIQFIYSVSDYYKNLLSALTAKPTEEELNSYVYQAKHILLLTVDMEGTPTVGEDGAYAYPALDEAAIAEKKALAEDLLARLNAAEDPAALFDELMNEYSEDSGLSANPDGYTSTLGKMVAPFEETALALDFGQISGIVESSYGYHIILRGEVEDLDSYADAYRETEMDAMVDEWLADSEIVQGDALKDLDVPAFYNRYVAWQAAYVAALETDADTDAAEE